ncbi:MAG: D-ribose pyranase [Ignavibacteriaceae bacterium]|jgi:D-ribose pyranase|nr:D-ribose pyranase [Ignavibacteriaceae bacterium]
MKKSGILNSQLSRIVASMGHTDKLVVADCGLPIPKKAEFVDLALTKDIPPFLTTLKIILEELVVEEAIVAEELLSNKEYSAKVLELLKDVKVHSVKHEEFKELYRNGGNVAFVRTGEATPYANVILFSGVSF